ncbi:MAG: glycine cleavage system aminomethyltransferase GcvT [Proteobacteria bacterium]|nr:glycine cleavage system aminomethyltransferase GcvT [Pseudomonadota bacterium]
MTETKTKLKRTPLYDRLREFGGKWVDFAGWEMPIQFTGIIEEHRAVRAEAGLFDLTHMGELEVRADDVAQCVEFVNGLVSNDISTLKPGAAMYTVVCNPRGNILDDIIVYRFESHLMLVVNASNRDKMHAWFRMKAPGGITVTDVSDDVALIALQGPKAEAILAPLASVDITKIAYYHFDGEWLTKRPLVTVAGVPCIISRTGYTGEDGFELYVENQHATALFDAVYAAAKPHGGRPIGLGARDTLRLEAKYALYGNELDEHTNPIEAGLSWVVKLAKPAFVGREVLEAVKAEGSARVLVGLQMLERGVPRHGFEVHKDGRPVGVVTSGTFSPTLEQAIALAYVERSEAKLHAIGTELDVIVRGAPCRAVVVKTPFHRGSVRSS